MPSTVADIFDIRYGHSLELNALHLSDEGSGVAFVSRQLGNNGISAYVSPIDGLEPAPAGDISCALGGNGLTTYIQEADFYCGRDVAILRPKIKLSKQQKLFYCLCIQTNRYRYNYGRQANKTLSSLVIPAITEIPNWVNATDLKRYEGLNSSLSTDPVPSLGDQWKSFRYEDLFSIERGRGPRKSSMSSTGKTPFITSTDRNNGLTGYVSGGALHKGNVISVNRNGSVGEAFYQPRPFSSTEDVHVFTPKFPLNKYIAMFIIPLIRLEKYRFNYGRKWGLDRMKKSVVQLPVSRDQTPNWALMEQYIRSLPYSKNI